MYEMSVKSNHSQIQQCIVWSNWIQSGFNHMSSERIIAIKTSNSQQSNINLSEIIIWFKWKSWRTSYQNLLLRLSISSKSLSLQFILGFLLQWIYVKLEKSNLPENRPMSTWIVAVDCQLPHILTRQSDLVEVFARKTSITIQVMHLIDSFEN